MYFYFLLKEKENLDIESNEERAKISMM
jgi:hypothetical protein